MAAAEPAAMRMAPATPRAFEAFDRFFEVVDAAVAGEVEADAFRDAFRLLEVRAAEAFFAPVFGFGEDVDFAEARFADDFLADVFAAGLRAGFDDDFFADDFFADDFFDPALVGADFLDAGFFEGAFLADDFFALPERFLLPVFLELAAM